MARPRIFVSSTYHDLKYLRSSLETFISALGYEPVLFERGDVSYDHTMPLDESCYHEVEQCDILVLLIGRRYGCAVSTHALCEDESESITEHEYRTAVSKGIPVYILVERAVHVEYETYKKNKDNVDIKYAHVDDTRVFRCIERILAQHRNNPIQTFEHPTDIEEWLREQWAGRFRDMLRDRASQQQLASLSAQVQVLTEANQTLRRYLEAVIRKEYPESQGVITEETERLKPQADVTIGRLTSINFPVVDPKTRKVHHPICVSVSVRNVGNSAISVRRVELHWKDSDGTIHYWLLAVNNEGPIYPRKPINEAHEEEWKRIYVLYTRDVHSLYVGLKELLKVDPNDLGLAVWADEDMEAPLWKADQETIKRFMTLVRNQLKQLQSLGISCD
ncbi:MAG: DUF4062 domain-containing protein [Armatimonadota bacterium]|nr:DUF4062 domain-containing protein [bacterium]